MILFLISILASIVPSILLVRWLKYRNEDIVYRNSCNYAIKRGLFCVIPIVLLGFVLNITSSALKATVLHNLPDLVFRAFYAMVILALVEETIKFLALKAVLKKENNAFIQTDVIALMVIIGAVFGMSETVLYIFDGSAGVMFARALTIPHVGYAFIMGWFYAKKLATGKTRYSVIGFLITYLLHGLYDFSLEPALIEVSDKFVFMAVGLAFLDIVLLVLTIRFFIRKRKE